MSLPLSPDECEPEEISYGTCQGLRVVRVGRVYLIQQRDTVDADKWKTIGKSDTGPDGTDDARHDAIVALNNMNQRVVELVRQNVERMR